MRQLLLAIALATTAAPAAAQPAPWQPERNTAGWVFTPAISFGGMWDSNATIRNEGNPAISELVGLVNPRGEIDFNGRLAKFSAGYSGALQAYREVSELTRYDQRGKLEARYTVTPRLTFSTRQLLLISPSTEQLELGGLPFTHVGSRLFDAQGGFAYAVSQRSTLGIDYNFQWVSFDREGAADFRLLQGGHSHSTIAEYGYKLSRHVNLGGVWTYRRTTVDGGEQLFNTQDVRGQVEVELGPATNIHGSVGMSHANIVRTSETQIGPSYGGGISHRAGQVMLNTRYDRSSLPSFGFGGLSASEVFHAGMSIPLARGRMFASSGFSWRRNEPTGVLEDPELGGITLNSYWWNSSFGFHATRWLRAEAFYALTHQVSDAQGNVDRHRIGIQFVTHKPMRIQ
jgi:hypothetical protein